MAEAPVGEVLPAASSLSLGLMQAGVATALALAVMLLARRQSIHVERETLVSLLRGAVQIVVVGLVLGLMLEKERGLWSALALVAMLVAAAATAARRTKDIRGAFGIALSGISAGAGLIIVGMTALGVIEHKAASLVPVGSMIIATAMNTCSQAIERFRADVTSHTGHIEAALALGASPASTVAPYVQSAVFASLIPRIDALRSLGIVWIPGLMAGMILAGGDPVYAALYQFVMIAMLYAASGLTAIATLLLIRTRAFSSAEQLVLRPAAAKGSGR